MQSLLRLLLILVVLAALGLGAGFYMAGNQPGPVIEVRSPADVIGQNGSLEFSVEAPGGVFSSIRAVLEQDGLVETVFSLEGADPKAEVQQQTADRLFVIRPIGRQAIPALKAGAARVTITAARPVFFGLRQPATVVTRDLQVRLEPPRISVASLHHFVNHGGAEFVVYRVSPPDVGSGVRVGTTEFPGYPGAGAGLSDAGLHVAFFALAHDQDLNAPIAVFARDGAGNEASTPLDHRIFPKPFAKSRIEIDQRFLDRVVPAITAGTPSLGATPAAGSDLVPAFLKINGELRQQNNATIAALASKTKPEILWGSAFAQLGNTAVQSRFADYRTYFFGGKEIDRQVHLGFDLASTAQAPVHASNRGTVLLASFLGIYGNCVIIDHGMGVQTLYAHLSSIDVREGDSVEKDQVIGRTGITGLAGGDHLHFTLLVGGTAVNPVEWWDPHWIEDRVFRKIREAGGTPPGAR
jgi:murein DD-endopeptidase MepM/ murein hydrolase activator NlpD